MLFSRLGGIVNRGLAENATTAVDEGTRFAYRGLSIGGEPDAGKARFRFTPPLQNLYELFIRSLNLSAIIPPAHARLTGHLATRLEGRHIGRHVFQRRNLV